MKKSAFVKNIYALLIGMILTFGFSSTSLAQKKRKRTKPKPVEKILMVPPMSVPSKGDCKPSSERMMISIAENGEIELDGNKVEKANLSQAVANHLCGKMAYDEIIYIKSSANTLFNIIAEAAKSGREFEVDDVILTLDDADGVSTNKLKISVEEPEKINKKIKAYPLMLTVAISPDGKLELNSNHRHWNLSLWLLIKLLKPARKKESLYRVVMKWKKPFLYMLVRTQNLAML